MEPTLTGDAIPAIDTVWVMVAAILVMFMQVGFLFLEVGFSRMKNAGTIVPKVLANFSIAALCYWAVGFALAFGGTGWFAGTEGTFLGTSNGDLFPAMAFSDAAVPAKFFFQFVFCAVSLAIVWGTTIERIKFGAYLIYAVVFSSLIYPIISHWIFGGGWLQANFGMQDFAGSTVVHLIGATGALAALLLLGPRQGKYGKDGSPNVIPGHNMPLVGLAVLVLWFGWFGFNAGLHARRVRTGASPRSPWSPTSRPRPACSARCSPASSRVRTFDIGMAGNGAIAALVAITAPSGYVEYWAAPIIGVRRRRDRRVLHHRHRQARRRPGRRAVRARCGGHLGHAGLRAVHLPAPGRLQRDRRGRPLLHGLVRAARRAGARRCRRFRHACSSSASSSSTRSSAPTACG